MAQSWITVIFYRVSCSSKHKHFDISTRSAHASKHKATKLSNPKGKNKKKSAALRLRESLNTNIVTFQDHNDRILQRISEITFAHELGHNAGSPVSAYCIWTPLLTQQWQFWRINFSRRIYISDGIITLSTPRAVTIRDASLCISFYWSKQ